MKDFVSSRRVSIVTAIASVLILWAIVAVPGGPAWSGLVALSVLMVLLTAASRLILGTASTVAVSEASHGTESEKRRTQ
jgi:hypothetical protein